LWLALEASRQPTIVARFVEAIREAGSGWFKREADADFRSELANWVA
jgi:hypothetical protein